MTGALAGLTMVELCDDVPGAACGRQFAAWGARVVVVEGPDGSPLRRAAPLVRDRAGETCSLLWEYLAAGKESAVCDLGDSGGRERFDTLLHGADVLITDRRPAGGPGPGLDIEALGELAPGAVIVSVTPFGLDGPYAALAGSDLITQALSGFLSLNGVPEREPLKAAANVLPIACGVAAFAGALAALRERDCTGEGGIVEAAGIETVASIVKLLATEYSGERHLRAGTIGAMFLPCRDGFITANPTMDRVWDDLLVALGVDERELPEALRTEEGRKDLALVERFLSERTREVDAEELFAFVAGLQVVSGLFRTPKQLVENPHLAARGFFHHLSHPRLGGLRFPGPPARLSETPMVAPTPAPEIGAGRDLPPGPLPEGRGSLSGLFSQPNHRTIAATAWRPKGPRSRLPLPSGRGPGGRSQPPLADIRVLDLTHAWIGPYATLLLADLGADVVKVESQRRPDVWRRLAGGPRPRAARPEAHPLNVSNLFNSVNRDKRSVDLDLATERGRELFLRLAASADIVIENFTPRVLDNLGLGWETLLALKPDLILVSFSGYGASGPYRDYKANGGTTETIAGWVSLYGYPDLPPLTMGTMQADATTGLQMAATALVALHHRDRTGYGQRIDGAMFDAAAGYIGDELLLAQLTDEPALPLGNRHHGMAPHGTFRCRDEGGGMRDEERSDASHPSSLRPHPSDRWVAIAVRDDADWARLVAALDEVPALRDPRYATLVGRQTNEGELDALLGEWARHQTAEAAAARLQAAGVPAGVVRHTDEVLDDPHLTARGWFRPRAHPDLGAHRYNGPPVRLVGTPSVHHRPPPLLGEHSEEILVEELGLSTAEYEALVADGITGTLRERAIEDATAAN